jgi:hypothetical protein
MNLRNSPAVVMTAAVMAVAVLAAALQIAL